MNSNFTRLLFLLFFLPVRLPAQPSQIHLPSDSILVSWLKEFNVPAVGIGIIQNNKISTPKVLGELIKDHAVPVNTIFQVASLTKPIVEVATLILVSNKLWNLEEPLYHYWIDPDVAADTTHKKLTTRHVMAHQTGFVNWRWLHATGKLTFDFAPGTRTQYSGEGLEYLKKALEIKFKQPLEKIVQRYLFLPYKMSDTRFYWDKGMDESRFALAHNKEGKPYEVRKYQSASAADLLMTTVADYTRFGYEVMNKTGLSNKIWNEMIRVQAPEQNSKFGLGWEIYRGFDTGEYVLLHTGSDPGVRTIIILLPQSKRGLVIFTNGDNGMQVILKIIGAALDIGDQLIKMGG